MLRHLLLENTMGCLPPPAPAALRPGQAVTVSVPARCTWSNTGVMMQPTETYELAASGTWKDGLTPACGPGGYDTSSLWRGSLFNRAEAWELDHSESWRRQPHHRWFSLTGCIGKSEAECFLIGAHHVLSPRRAGVMHVFPNDVPGMYWNNKGAILLRITRLT